MISHNSSVNNYPGVYITLLKINQYSKQCTCFVMVRKTTRSIHNSEYKAKKKYFASHQTRASRPWGRIKTIDAPLEVHHIEEIKGFPTVVEFCV